MMFKAANQKKIRFSKNKRLIEYPEYRELYVKYTLPKWYKEVGEEAVVDTLAKSLNHDFGSYYTSVDSGVSDDGTPYIVIIYGDIGKLTDRYAFHGQETVDTVLNELIYLHFLNYGEQRIKEIIDGFLKSRKN